MAGDNSGQLFQINGDPDELIGRLQQVCNMIEGAQETVLKNKANLEGFENIGGLAKAADSLLNIANIMGNALGVMTRAVATTTPHVEALAIAQKMAVEF
jgi:hypothetical protein